MNKAVLRNVSINAVGLILPTFVSLATVPAYISLLGVDRYGAVNLVWVLVGYFGILDFGLGMATERQIAKASADRRHDVADIFWSAFWVNLLTGVLGGLAIFFTADYCIHHIFRISPQLQLEMTRCLPWIALAVPIANVGWVFGAALTACERFRSLTCTETLGTFLFQLVPLAYAWLTGASLLAVVASAVVARFIGVAALGGLAVSLRGIRCIRPPSMSAIRDLFGFGRWAVIQSVAGMASESLDRVLIGSMLGTHWVAFYTVPQNLVARMNFLPNAMLRALFPRFSRLGGLAANDLALPCLQFLNAVFTPCAIIASFALEPFLSHWISPAFADQAAPVGRNLVIAAWFAGQTSIIRILMFAQSGTTAVVRLSWLLLPIIGAALGIGIHFHGIVGASIVMMVYSAAEYGLYLYFARIAARTVIVDMAVQLAIALAAPGALAITGAHLDISETLVAATALISVSLTWSCCTSALLRNGARDAFRRFFPSDALSPTSPKPAKEPIP